MSKNPNTSAKAPIKKMAEGAKHNLGLAANAAAGGAKKVAIAAQKGALVAVDATTVAAAAGVKAALAGADLAKKGAVVVWDGAKKVKTQIDQKTRKSLDAEYSQHAPIAAKNLERIRMANPSSTPSEIIKLLEREYFASEVTKGADAADFIASTTTFVLSVVAIHGKHVRNTKNSQALIDWVMVGNSKSASIIAEYGSLAILLIPKIPIPAIQKAFTGAQSGLKAVSEKDLAQKLLKFAAGAAPFLAKLGIKNPGHQSMGRMIAAITRKTLGPAPKSWPSTKPAAARKPAAKKPAAQKPSA